jgi:trans-2,3-dihydro-3-hydroxyanthranilate isomerase
MSTSLTARTLEYALVDVFAERPLEGNQLAIFTDARGLSTAEMQALARETNLAETTFIFPGDAEQERREGVRVRIFTTQEELPFAGHPTLGTSAWLYWHHPTLRGAETLTLQLNAGPIPVRFDPPAAGDHGVFATMRQNDPVFGPIHEPAEIARILNLPIEDLEPALPIQTVSTGIPFCIVPLRSLEGIRRLAIPQAIAQTWLAAAGAKFFFCIAPADPASGAHFHNRMQFYNGEDPATGSASGCAIAWLVRHGVVPSGRPTIFEQGIEILRPSRLHVRATLTGEGKDFAISDVFVSGRTIPVASGRLFLP